MHFRLKTKTKTKSKIAAKINTAVMYGKQQRTSNPPHPHQTSLQTSLQCAQDGKQQRTNNPPTPPPTLHAVCAGRQAAEDTQPHAPHTHTHKKGKANSLACHRGQSSSLLGRSCRIDPKSLLYRGCKGAALS